MQTESAEVYPGSTTSVTIDKLESNTEYKVTLLLDYQMYLNYEVPGIGEAELIVRTDQAAPGRLNVKEATCNDQR